jgi:hypothetical protein
MSTEKRWSDSLWEKLKYAEKPLIRREFDHHKSLTE